MILGYINENYLALYGFHSKDTGFGLEHHSLDKLYEKSSSVQHFRTSEHDLTKILWYIQ